ncbi:uncharacterized protein LOC121988613 isoform X1 [Zingiber officinale]|uniref:uncharacterized protein LOC121988613 isoform X1 n=1 Tax=Zingiber officinale TaxID=94328 RepID=UPI001C4C5F49|nr:uncharacterized protein LOC121988613 isoform X1 [Zingiber officinale]
MDACALNLSSGGAVPQLRAARNNVTMGSAPLYSSVAGWAIVGGEAFSRIKVRVSARGRRWSPSSRFRSAVVRSGSEKKNNHGNSSSSAGKDDSSIPEEDDGLDENFAHHGKQESNDPMMKSQSAGKGNPSIPEEEDDLDENFPHFKEPKPNELTSKSHHELWGWRDFRANLVAREKEQLHNHTSSNDSPTKLSVKWAHPIPMPEVGCVLVATEKLDREPNFGRTVILLLRLGTKNPRDGPIGIILNHHLHIKIKDMNPSNTEVASTFANCTVDYGGPLVGDLFLMNSQDSSLVPRFNEMISGICFGDMNNVVEVAALVKKGVVNPNDIRFFVGYASWHIDQLLQEIKSDYWVVAACSSGLIKSSAHSPILWEEILQLMGGQYSDLSRKPRQDD